MVNTLTAQPEGPGSNPGWVRPVFSLLSLLMPGTPVSKNKCQKLIDVSKLVLRVNVRMCDLLMEWDRLQ